MVYICISLGVISAFQGILLLYAYFSFKRLKAKQKKEKTQDATELLAELMSGGAVVVTQVIDPSSMFMYSPRDR